MPYPKETAKAKHDIVSPSTISISSGKLTPMFDSSIKIIQQIKSKDFKLQKLALKVLTYDDVPSVPRKPSSVMFFAGFCPLSFLDPSSSSSSSSGFDYHSFVPLEGMTVCHMTVKRADKASLPQQDLDMSNKFTGLCNNLRSHNMVALIQCPKTDRTGFLIPMNEKEDGYNFAAYLYIGRNEDAEKMILDVEKGVVHNGIQNNHKPEESNDHLESDEPIWKPDGDDDDHNNYDPNAHDNGTTMASDDANNDMWRPPGINDETGGGGGDDDNMWKPPGDDDNNNDTSNIWQPPGSSTNENNEEGNLWDQPINESTENDNLWQQQEEQGISNQNTMSSQENKFHADSGAAAADKFYSELTRSLDTRAESILYHMRNFNGWVKATQIAELDPNTISSGNGKKRKRTRHPLRILDLACGKGGDLGKWTLHNRGVQSYVGSDVARGSLVDAAIRARKMSNQLKDRCTFICADLGSDVPGRPKNRLRGGKMQKLLSWSLEHDNGFGDPIFQEIRGGGIKESDKFDVVSIQCKYFGRNSFQDI